MLPGFGGVVIATSNGHADSGGSDAPWDLPGLSECTAKESLLQVDDEYDAMDRQRFQRSQTRFPTAAGADSDDGTPRHLCRSDEETSPLVSVYARTREEGGTPNGESHEGLWADDDEDALRQRYNQQILNQQRQRVEEMLELQRVYSKALHKTFRSLKGMPEPSYDAPICLCEEDIDQAEAIAAEIAAQAADGAGSSTLQEQTHYHQNYVRRYFAEGPSSENSPSGHTRSERSGSLELHADCTDHENIIVAAEASAWRGYVSHTAQPAESDSRTGFVSRLRRRANVSCEE